MAESSGTAGPGRVVGGAASRYRRPSLLIGARTEELRALTWDHVDLEGALAATPSATFNCGVALGTGWRKDEDQEFIPHAEAAEQVRGSANVQRELQGRQRDSAGKRWQENGLVFASSQGTMRNANNVLRSFRAVVGKVPALKSHEWTPREMRHNLVSLLSDSGVPIENIARLAGHAGGSAVTETI